MKKESPLSNVSMTEEMLESGLSDVSTTEEITESGLSVSLKKSES